MLKRLFDIANANWNHWRAEKKAEPEFEFRPEEEFHHFSEQETAPPSHPLAQYYANLELKPGASRQELKNSWRRLMKKYHPDLHSKDEEKKRIADELTRRLNEAYHILDKDLAKHEKG
jgi:DnaJ-domain-containing protein 1